MTPDPSRFGGAALRDYQCYRYTIARIVNGAAPHTEEAELWWKRVEDPEGKWHYFRRHVATQADDAGRRVEEDFTQWVDGRLEAEGSGE